MSEPRSEDKFKVKVHFQAGVAMERVDPTRRQTPTSP